VGLEPLAPSTAQDNDLRQTPQDGAAESGAVSVDPSTLTLEALAAALLALPPADRARLAALLLGGEAKGSDQTAGDTGTME
jgi:hypothetical protein